MPPRGVEPWTVTCGVDSSKWHNFLSVFQIAELLLHFECHHIWFLRKATGRDIGTERYWNRKANFKAPEDGIQLEEWKFRGGNTRRWWKEIIWRKEGFLSDWRKGVVVSIHKKRRSEEEEEEKVEVEEVVEVIQNYTGTSLLNTVYNF